MCLALEKRLPNSWAYILKREMPVICSQEPTVPVTSGIATPSSSSGCLLVCFLLGSRSLSILSS